jgi:uncharacterized protein (DUF1330 family)
MRIMKPFATFAVAIVLAGSASPSASVYARGGHGHYHLRGPSTPADLVIDINEIIQADDLESMLQKIPGSLAAFNGHIIVDSTSVTSLDGAVPARFVVIQFDDVEKASEWNASNEGKEFEAVRHRATKSREFMVVGRPTEAGIAFGGRNSAARQAMMKIRDEELKSLRSICKGC